MSVAPASWPLRRNSCCAAGTPRSPRSTPAATSSPSTTPTANWSASRSKTANVNAMGGQDTALFNISNDQLVRPIIPDLVYVFAIRRTDAWDAFITLWQTNLCTLTTKPTSRRTPMVASSSGWMSRMNALLAQASTCPRSAIAGSRSLSATSQQPPGSPRRG